MCKKTTRFFWICAHKAAHSFTDVAQHGTVEHLANSSALANLPELHLDVGCGTAGLREMCACQPPSDRRDVTSLSDKSNGRKNRCVGSDRDERPRRRGSRLVGGHREGAELSLDAAAAMAIASTIEPREAWKPVWCQEVSRTNTHTDWSFNIGRRIGIGVDLCVEKRFAVCASAFGCIYARVCGYVITSDYHVVVGVFVMMYWQCHRDTWTEADHMITHG